MVPYGWLGFARAASVAALLGLVTSGLAACRRDEAAGDRPAPATVPEPPTEQAGPLRWVHDDYPAALAHARALGRPLFVDLWAAWCHTCVSMQETVLRDPAMAPFADRFVWLALDTEKAANARALEALPPEAWPTFFVVSPAGPGGASVEARHVGAASLAQLRELLEVGEQGHLGHLAEQGALADPALAHLREGERAAARGDHRAAATAYAAALTAAPADWPRAPAVLVKLASARSRAGDKPGCAELADDALPRTRLGATASAADFASTVNGCADELPADEAAALRRALVASVEAVLAAKPGALSADDRGDALAILRGLAEKLGEPDRARAYATQQRDLLDAAAAAAPSPWAASTYNLQRADAYVYLGEGAAIVPVLQKSVADLPREYDPPYRLAGVFLALGRFDEGIAAAEQARALATGPRRALVLNLLARLHHGKGDHATERRLLDEAVALLEGLPIGQRRPSSLNAALAAVEAYGRDHGGQAPISNHP